jgi:hypothetical protein
MKESREQIEISDGEAESNSIFVLLYEKEHWHVMWLRTHQRPNEHRDVMCFGTHQKQEDHWHVMCLGTHQQQKEHLHVMCFINKNNDNNNNNMED